MDQVKSTMKVTLWVFIGIEGPWWSPPVPAIARTWAAPPCWRCWGPGALRHGDPVLPGGHEPAATGGPQEPSTAMILEAVVGPWGAWLINIGLVISVMGPC